jgi:hypothetical protein
MNWEILTQLFDKFFVNRNTINQLIIRSVYISIFIL